MQEGQEQNIEQLAKTNVALNEHGLEFIAMILEMAKQRRVKNGQECKKT